MNGLNSISRSVRAMNLRITQNVLLKLAHEVKYFRKLSLIGYVKYLALISNIAMVKHSIPFKFDTYFVLFRIRILEVCSFW